MELSKNTLNPVYKEVENDYRYWTIVYQGSEKLKERSDGLVSCVLEPGRQVCLVVPNATCQRRD